MPGYDEGESFRIVFGACSMCNEPMYYPPLRVPSLYGMRWDPVDPTRAVAEMKNVCIKKKCIKKATAAYRKELEQGEVVIEGLRPRPYKAPIASSTEESEERADG